jgi:hypothetical protein
VIVYNNPAFHYESSYNGRRTKQQGGDRVFSTGIGRIAKIKERDIRSLSWFQATDISSAKALGSTYGCHSQRMLHRDCRGAMPKPLQ